MGDFYEMFFDDALKAAPLLEVQLTSRDKNAAEPIPMCGVPHHSAIGYIQKLLSHGHKVALCEQLEDPAAAKGIVKRAVVRVLTPALVGDPELVSEDQKYYLLSIHAAGDGTYGLCLVDLLDNQLRVGTASSAAAIDEVWQEYLPREILTDSVTAQSDWLKRLKQVGTRRLVTERSDYFTPQANVDAAANAQAALMLYLAETQKTDSLPTFGEPQPLFSSSKMVLDSVTLAALEITRPASEGGRSLAQTIDDTVTPMGRRLLRDWLSQPSRDNATLDARHNAVESLVNNAELADGLRTLLKPMRDLERLSTKTALGLAMPRDLVAIREVLLQLPELRHRLVKSPCHALAGLGEKINPLPELTSLLQQALEDQAPGTFRDGGIFKSSFHPQIAEYRTLSQDAKGTIAAMEERERNRTGISSLKIKFNRVFGYTIEITNSYLAKVPSDYTRKQTISTGERFITEELKTFEEKVISADHRLKTIEESLFLETRRKVAELAPTLSANARLLSEIDILQGFACTARERGYQRPRFNTQSLLTIEDGRHPVVEALLPVGQFVPNSIRLCPESSRTIIITGPNMGGKSTIMRQVALTCVLAQAGSFVPAARADLPILDAIFTRIGSSDDLARGRSTFMVEMTEVARILKTATPQSLILIDEIGRGTSTYDGLSLAWSLLEHLHNVVRAKTLFATHFHEITALETALPGVKNANVLVEKWKEEVVFLYKLGPGICNRSYGIEVAKLAGLPSEVLVRARDIQGLLESQSQRGNKARHTALEQHAKQMGFFDEGESPETLAPLES
jgi:DNA mismatch repair protein MutS